MPGKALVPDGNEKSLKRRSALNLFHRAHHDDRSTARSAVREAQPAQRAVSQDAPRLLSLSFSYSNGSDRSSSPSLPSSQFDAPHTNFGLMRFRHASDSQLNARAKAQAERDVPPLPAMPTTNPANGQRGRLSDGLDDPSHAPTVMVTAPTTDGGTMHKAPALERRRSKFHPFSRQRQADAPTMLETQSARPSLEVRRKAENRKSRFGTFGRSRDPAEELRRLAGSRMAAPGGNGGHGGQSGQASPHGDSMLTLPVGRKSESSRSDHAWFGPSPTSPVRPKPQSNSSFPKLLRRNRNKASAFPLPMHMAPPTDGNHFNRESDTPRASLQSTGTPEESPARTSPARQARGHAYEVYTGGQEANAGSLAATAAHLSGPGSSLLPRPGSNHSLRSAHSSPALNLPQLQGRTRMRSYTQGSSAQSDDSHPPTPPIMNGSSRTSTSTTGRTSFSNFFQRSHRLRHGGEFHSPGQGSPGHGSPTHGLDSHTTSLSISRDTIALPEREDGETPMQFLMRVEGMAPKSQIPSVLSKRTAEFYSAVLRSFMRRFAFFGDPLDMALRKLLMEIDLPKETQQIDRVLQSYADRYHECNPGVFSDSDKAYYMTFSLLLLQSDAFNKSNKRKMAKSDYVKNSSTDGVSDYVLECFYDNITYTPFIRVEDDIDVKTMSSRKAKKTQRVLKHAVEPMKPKTPKEPLDPYTLILEDKLDMLRPQLRSVIAVDDPYTYLGTSPAFDKKLLRGLKCGIIQLESSRSRPDAFASQSGIDNPNDANIGIIDLPVQKVGLLWRKDPKKRTARSPWQEWGAILTGAGLYFFKNSHFVKNFIGQYEEHVKHGDAGQLTFKPSIQTWRADYLMPTENGVALHDSTYKKHKNAFVFFRHSNADEVFLADNEGEMNDWVMKLNCQAAFKTYGIRARGLVGSMYEGQRQRGMRRLDSSTSTSTLKTIQSPTGDVTVVSGKIDREQADQISAVRRNVMQNKITELEDKLADLIMTERGQRRDAAHLFVLAPIQERTRNQLIQAASKVSTQLKLSRIEIWRIKCHRDILAMDLEEERMELHRRQDKFDKMDERMGHNAPKANSITSQSTTSTAKPRANGIERLNSTATAGTTVSDSPAKSILSRPLVVRPDSRNTQRAMSRRSSVITMDDDDVFQTPPERTPTSSPMSQTPPLNTPIGKASSLHHRASMASTLGKSPNLLPKSPTIEEPEDSPVLSDFRTPMLTDAEAEQQREALGGLGPSPAGVDGTQESSSATMTMPEEEKVVPPTAILQAGSPDSRKQSRRSIQRSVRDHPHRESSKDSSNHTHHVYLHHHRSRKSGKSDSVGSAVLSQDGTEEDTIGEPKEGLKRHEGSFTVHGKKASVITFSGDFADMVLDAGERLKILARQESEKNAERLGSPTGDGTFKDKIAPLDLRTTNFVGLAPRKSSASLGESRRAASHSVARGDHAAEDIGTAKSLRKFSSSSGPPNFEDLRRHREDVVANGGEDPARQLALDEKSEEEEEFGPGGDVREREDREDMDEVDDEDDDDDGSEAGTGTPKHRNT